MSNLTAGVPPQPYGLGGRTVYLPLQATAQVYEGSLISQIAGACVSAGASGAGNVVGVAMDDGLGGATDGAKRLRVMTDQIFIFNAGSNAPTDATPYGTVLFAETDNTVGTGAGNEAVIAGRFVGTEDDGRVRVFISAHASWFDTAANLNDGGTAPFKCRAVATSLGANTGTTTGALTVTATGALGAQDGVTMVAGDLLFVPAGLANLSAASDSGPYVVTNAGGTGVHAVLTRPSWWQTGAGIVPSQNIEIGGEGTVWKGATFKAMCAKSKVVDTDDPHFYPKNFRKTVTLSSGTYTLGFGGGSEQLFLYDTTLATVQLTSNTHAGTIGTSRLEAPAASRVAGYPGTAVVVINSLVDAGTVAGSDTSTVDVLVTNW